MKESNLLIRIDDGLKNSFKKLCIDEGTTMSNKVQEFIKEEVSSKNKRNTQEVMAGLLSLLNYKNVKIIAIPNFFYKDGEMIDGDFAASDSPGHVKFCTTQTSNMSLNDFLEKYKDKQVFLYAAGSDFYNNKIQACIIE